MTSPPHAARLSITQRLALRALIWGVALTRRLPDEFVYRAAYALGSGLSLLMPARRRVARANLARVCTWLADAGMATPRVAAAAAGGRALDRMVRAAFGHWAVSYAESMMAPRYGSRQLQERIVAEDPAASAGAIVAGQRGGVGRIHLGMHFGSVDLSAIYATRVGGQSLAAPMERVDDPVASAWFEHVRGELGVDIVPLAGAAAGLRARLARGETVGLVADRMIVGSGTRVTLFGAPVRLPRGPAVLAAETGAPIYLTAVARTGTARWVGHTIRIEPPAGVSRREAVRWILEQEARAFERIVAIAPEQWSTMFFPIWDVGGEESP